MSLPVVYAERVYAGVLGMTIGVYLGRPFEGWSYERFHRRLGSIQIFPSLAAKAEQKQCDLKLSGKFL